MDFNYDTNTFTMLSSVTGDEGQPLYLLEMFTADKITYEKEDMIPAAWRDFFTIYAGDETYTIAYSKFARAGDIYAFHDQIVGSTESMVKVLSPDQKLAELTSTEEGVTIGEYVWLSFDPDEAVVLDDSSEVRALILAVSRETTVDEVSTFSVDIYRIHPYF
jgi:hypothetical protein